MVDQIADFGVQLNFERSKASTFDADVVASAEPCEFSRGLTRWLCLWARALSPKIERPFLQRQRGQRTGSVPPLGDVHELMAGDQPESTTRQTASSGERLSGAYCTYNKR